MKLNLSLPVTGMVLFVTTAAFSQVQVTPRRGGTPPVGNSWHSGKMEQKMPGRPGPPPFDWWRNSDVAQKLNLTDQQKQQLEQTFTQQKEQLKDLRDALQKEETKLQDLMNADNVQEPQIVAQIDATQAARAKLQRSFAMMALQFRKVLTADQWKQLREQEIVMFHRRDRGDRPPGGPDGPPPVDAGNPPRD
jgi:Spy/CpxP family protein refolding chaperone